MKFKEICRMIFRVHKNAIKKELEEIKNLKPTEEDYAQGEVMADAAIAAMVSLGLTHTVLEQRIIAKVFAYGIRDVKDGIADNKKLLIGRVIEEIKHEREQQKENNKQEEQPKD